MCLTCEYIKPLICSPPTLGGVILMAFLLLIEMVVPAMVNFIIADIKGGPRLEDGEID